MCCEAFEWSCPSCWNSGSSLSRTKFSDVDLVSSSPEKTNITLETISSTKKNASAISLPRMSPANLSSVLTLCDDSLHLHIGDII